ncbi:hypothetical protein [Dysosmobacter sp.]|uniref:hypothetical protein n=1 Tax=Dysosmobacter sp. TaxID=2591382 RepID=UPI003AB80080
MAIASRFLAVALIVFLVLIVGGVALQIFLSRRKSKWLGLILPLLTFLYALALTLNVTSTDGAFPWGALLAAFLLGNIPTLVLLAIYWAVREKFRVRDQIDKMNIDDL